MNITKILSTVVISTLFNGLTACMKSEKIQAALIENDTDSSVENILAPILAGFTLSTVPALCITTVGKILSLGSSITILTSVAATFLGYDHYLKFACPKQSKLDEIVNESKGFFHEIKYVFTENEKDMEKAVTQKLSNEIYKYEQQVCNNNDLNFAYKINTIAQVAVFDYIWTQNEESPEIENTEPELVHNC